MARKQRADAVDAILEQWRRERPDLDVSPMGPIGRLRRCSALVQRELDKTFSLFSLTSWEFDVLATLRRSGAPYCLAPTALFSSLMITSGTMTRQLQQLEARDLVSRMVNPKDARSMLVQLTRAGLERIDSATQAHVENEKKILEPIKPTDLKQFDYHLAQMLAILEPA